MTLQEKFKQHIGKIVGQDSQQALLNISKTIEFRAGVPFVTQGDISEHVFFMREGIARYYISSEDGREANKTFAPAPSLLGSTYGLITGKPCRMSIAPLYDSEALALSWPEFRVLMDERHDIDRYYRLDLERLFLMKEARESEFLLKSAEQRYWQFIVDHKGFWQQIPQYHIASYLGITPVSLSRLRHKKRAHEKSDHEKGD